MPFVYRLQKVLEFRIRKKEEQLLVVQKAQQAVFEAEENIRKNEEEIRATKLNMRSADPMMYDAYDKYLVHLWEKAEQLEQIRIEKQCHGHYKYIGYDGFYFEAVFLFLFFFV